jgi:hypothetical protein
MLSVQQKATRLASRARDAGLPRVVVDPGMRGSVLYGTGRSPRRLFRLAAAGTASGRLEAVAAIAEKSRIYLRDVQEEAEKLIWEMQAQALAPLAAAGKLGCMPFSFRPGLRLRAHIDYLKQLRDRGDWPICRRAPRRRLDDQQLAETLSLP